MSGPGEVIHIMRQRRGLSQKQLAALVDTTQRQIARYESGEQVPSLAVSERLSFTLGITLDVLAGRVPLDLDMGGVWHFAWQSGHDVETIALSMAYRDGTATFYGESKGWYGELRHWDQSLAGWFRSAGQVSGAVFLELSADWSYAAGSWTGTGSQPHVVERGWCAMARVEAQATALTGAMVARNGELPGTVS